MRALLLALLCWCATAAWAGADVVTIVYADYAPYSWEAGGRVQGLEVDILEEALGKRLGMTLVHRVLPWKRAQQAVKDGVADAFVATPSAERAAFADAGREPVAHWELSLFFRKGDERFARPLALEELARLRVGSLIGNGWVTENLPGQSVQYVASMDLLPRMLALGRIDVVPDNPYVMHHLLKGRPEAAQIAELPLPEQSKGMFLHVGRASPLRARLAQVDDALRRMRADGSLQRLQARYKRSPGS